MLYTGSTGTSLARILWTFKLFMLSHMNGLIMVSLLLKSFINFVSGERFKITGFYRVGNSLSIISVCFDFFSVMIITFAILWIFFYIFFRDIDNAIFYFCFKLNCFHTIFSSWKALTGFIWGWFQNPQNEMNSVQKIFNPNHFATVPEFWPGYPQIQWNFPSRPSVRSEIHRLNVQPVTVFFYFAKTQQNLKLL